MGLSALQIRSALALCCSFLALMALLSSFVDTACANPLLVRDYEANLAILRSYQQIPAAEKQNFYEKNKERLIAAQQVLEDVQSVYGAVVEANKAAMSHYGQAFLCTLQSPAIEDLIASYRKRKGAEERLSEAEIREASGHIPIEIVLVEEMFRLQPCPGWKRD